MILFLRNKFCEYVKNSRKYVLQIVFLVMILYVRQFLFSYNCIIAVELFDGLGDGRNYSILCRKMQKISSQFLLAALYSNPVRLYFLYNVIVLLQVLEESLTYKKKCEELLRTEAELRSQV